MNPLFKLKCPGGALAVEGIRRAACPRVGDTITFFNFPCVERFVIERLERRADWFAEDWFEPIALVVRLDMVLQTAAPKDNVIAFNQDIQVETRLAKMREAGWDRMSRGEIAAAVRDAAAWAGDSEAAKRALGELSSHVHTRFGVHIDTLSGHVTTGTAAAANVSVFIFPEDEALPTSGELNRRRVQQLRTNPTGDFTASLPPGRYLVASTDDAARHRTLDVETLESMRSRAVSVSLALGDTKTIDLKTMTVR